jgi:hypothetical protein
MNSELREALDRTLLLMRDELLPDARDEELLSALTSTEVVLVGDAVNLATHAAQSAFVTAAILMMRSGHRVHLVAPDVPMIGVQPPLRPGGLVTSLMEFGGDLLPSVQFYAGAPRTSRVDLQITIGNTRPLPGADHTVSMNATAWVGSLVPKSSATRWQEPSWPMGPLAAAALAAGEAFKLAMHRLRKLARSPANFAKLFARAAHIRFELAPPSTPKLASVGALDFVSGGAITHAALFCLLRIVNLRGTARIIEDTLSDSSNLNRYALLRASNLLEPKTATLQRLSCEAFTLSSADVRLEASTAINLLPLAPRVLLGVDHIPTRWFAQELAPGWLGIGATTHWNAMASFHVPGLACARCLHPRDDQNDLPIPTVAFVSFWSGLLLASYLIRSCGVGGFEASHQHIFLTPLRAETPWWGAVSPRPKCLSCGTAQVA